MKLVTVEQTYRFSVIVPDDWDGKFADFLSLKTKDKSWRHNAGVFDLENAYNEGRADDDYYPNSCPSNVEAVGDAKIIRQ